TAIIQQLAAHSRVFTYDHVQNPLPVMSIEHAIADLLDRDGRQWSFQRRFPYDTIPTHGRDQRVPRPHCYWKIKGRDHGHNSQRMPLLIHTVLWTLAVHREAIELP